MADVPAARPFRVRDLLSLPDFRRLYLAQAISETGDGMTFLALFLVVIAQTGSTAAIALMSILVALPPVTIGLFAGAWADRSDRRRIMVVSDSLRAVVVLGLVPAAVNGWIPVLFALAAVQAVIGTFFTPARTALVPRVVPPEGLLAANSLSQMTRMGAVVIGGSVTGVIAGVTGVAWPVFILDAATFLASVLIVLRVTREIGRPDAATAASMRAGGIGHAVLDGLRLIAGSTPLVAALGGMAVTMLGVGAINVLFVPFLVTELGASPAWAGPLDGAQMVAMVISGAFLARLAARFSVPRLFVGGLLGVSACIAAFAVVPGPAVLLLLMFGAGLFVMPVQATTTTIIQSTTSDATRGRVAGALNAVMQAATIGSMAAAGILADVIGMRRVFAIGGGVILLAAVVAWALFRRAPAGAAVEAARSSATA